MPPHLIYPLPQTPTPHHEPVTVERVDVLGVPVAVLTRPMLTSVIYNAVVSETRGWITYANIHSVNEAFSSPWLRKFYQESLICYCDGQGIRLGAKLLGKSIPERITLPDFLEDLCLLARDHKFTLFLLGSADDVAERAAKVLQDRYPGLMITGFHRGFFDPGEMPAVIETINKANPDILLIGMGIPIQEEWIRDHFQPVRATVAWAAGGVLELISGSKSRCPRWMSSWGLEWVYRLFQEPRRLWKRYLLGNLLFLMRIIRNRLFSRS
jgi:N-acetylglucosaminyldiphosphoundecaprenol N-acetyl-beta-D-mannosaminyltransferase